MERFVPSDLVVPPNLDYDPPMAQVEKQPIQSDFRFVLQQELLERCRRNPKYSLRAYAKALGVSPSALSDMLNGKRPITRATHEKLGLALGLPLESISQFKETTKKARSRRQLIASEKIQILPLDTFSLISDWYHYAILELLKVRGFRHDTAWIARALSITKSEANIAIERLLRLGLIEEQADGALRDTSQGFTTNIDKRLTTAGAKKLQRQILEQSIKALIELPLEVRNHTAMTMAVDPRRLPEAIELIKKFRRELAAMMEDTDAPLEVYQLAVSLFPVTAVQNKGR